MIMICFITAIYGNYELSCKPYTQQTIPTDFICFTDNNNICSNGWTIDTKPYHIHDKHAMCKNSICNNKHPRNISKYYKIAFQNIPILQEYDIIIWIDGNIEIISNRTSEYIADYIQKYKMVCWHHPHHFGLLRAEVKTSAKLQKYICEDEQPFQDIWNQYQQYIDNGYDDDYLIHHKKNQPHLGVWLTCFMAFNNKDKYISEFLQAWYQQILEHTTNDKISLPYVCYKLGMIPYTLPDDKIFGIPNMSTQLYIKHPHHE